LAHDISTPKHRLNAADTKIIYAAYFLATSPSTRNMHDDRVLFAGFKSNSAAPASDFSTVAEISCFLTGYPNHGITKPQANYWRINR
jgi:hypothetical protein